VVRNLTPTYQSFVIDDPIPEHTTFVYSSDWRYDPDSNSIHWEGKIRPYWMRHTEFWVRVDRDTPVGTIITNEAYLSDDAVGGSASLAIEVVE